MLGFLVVLFYLSFFIPLVVKSIKQYRNRDNEKNYQNRWRSAIVVAIVGPVLLSAVLYSFGVYTDFLWFDNLSFGSIFWTNFWTKLIFGLSGTAIAFVVFFLSTSWIGRTRQPIPATWPSKNRGRFYDYFDWRKFFPVMNWGRVILITIASVGFGFWSSSFWQSYLLFSHQSTVGVSDPIFGMDLSFYLFSYDFYGKILTWVAMLLMFNLVFTGIWTAIIHHLTKTTQEREVFGTVRDQLSKRVVVLISLLALPVILHFILKIFGLMYSESGAVFGAGWVDIHVRYPAHVVLAVGTLVLAAFLILLSFRPNIKFKYLVIAVSSYAGALLLGLLIVPLIFQAVLVSPSELQTEKEYIEYNIKYTRQAFSLDQIEEHKLPVVNDLSYERLADFSSTLDNVRLWDWKALLASYRQLQEIRYYYEFGDVDVDRYTIFGGQYRQVMLAARELPVSQLDEQSQTWENQHLRYTHGYGVCLNGVNEFDSEGLPKMLIKDIPPVVGPPELRIDRPEIYFGENTGNHVFVRASINEFDYPMGDDNQYAQYQGNGGIPLGSGLRRLAFAWEFDGIKLLISEYLSADSRIMYHRNILERVSEIAPFLSYDADPYVVISDGRLYWILDAFTLSNRYPYSESYDGRFNYIRNSVKVVVDAYDGDVSFYVFDLEDPIIKTWQSIYPELFKTSIELSDDLRTHIRYPEDMLKVQSRMYGVYHMTNPQVFYNREDTWVWAREIYEDASQSIPVEPYFVMMQLPGETGIEFIQMLPFTPRDKMNMIGWMASRMDGDHYGELFVYKLPKGEFYDGPEKIETMIDQDPEMSSQLTLWKQKGSEVIRGNTLSIPLGQSFLHVQPIYLRADNSPMPQLRRVVVSYNKKVVWAGDFQTALRRVFDLSDNPTIQAVEANGEAMTESKLIERANENYQNYLKLMGEGKAVEAGQALEFLGQTLQQLQSSR